MRAAPPAVEIVLGSGVGERAVGAVLYAGAATAVAAWLGSHGLPTHGAAPVVAAAGLAAACLGVLVWRPAVGCVRWDGQGWSHQGKQHGQSPQPLRDVRLQADLSFWMLVRLTRGDDGRTAWFGLSRRQAGPAWHAARLALYHCRRARASDDEVSS